MFGERKYRKSGHGSGWIFHEKIHAESSFIFMSSLAKKFEVLCCPRVGRPVIFMWLISCTLTVASQF